MTPERWAQIEDLFHRAADCAAGERAALLDDCCKEDEELRQQVERLLAADESASHEIKAAFRDGIEEISFPLLGETVSHYRIMDVVGGGGMGLVYKAEDLKLGRQVAIKFLPEESAQDPDALGRFEREARSASSLEHSNICPIYEFGEHDGQPFLVMQLLQGKTLRELIAERAAKSPPFEVREIVDLSIQICSGLEAAHQHGIIHRDIKPANIFVTDDGQGKILDFGLAKLWRADAGDDVSRINPRERPPLSKDSDSGLRGTPDTLLSRTGRAMGTAGYMSPEQVRGEELDARTDLFSLGLVLYEMATGRRAFRGDTGPELQEAILKQSLDSPRKTNPMLPAKLEMVIGRALEKGRDARFQSAAQMQAELESLAQELAAKPGAFRLVAALGVAAVAAAIGVFVWAAKSRQPTPLPSLLVKYRQVTTNSPENPVMGGSISRDGKYLIYSDRKGLHAKVIDTGEVRSIPQPAELDPKTVSWEVMGWAFGDGTRFFANAHRSEVTWGPRSSENASIWVGSVLGGVTQKIRDHVAAYGGSPDGRQIAFAGPHRGDGESEIWVMDADGQHPHKVLEAEGNGHFDGFAWLPDGKRFLYVKEDRPNEFVELAQDISGGPAVTIFEPEEMRELYEQNWLHDGRYVYAVRESDEPGTCNYWVRRIDWHTGQRLDTPRKLTNWTGMCAYGGSVSADDKRFTFLGVTSKNTVYLADLDSSGTRVLRSRDFTPDLSSGNPMAWTPDSKSIIFFSRHNHQDAIYKQRLDQDGPELITSDPGYFHDAHISPDGKWVFCFIYPRKGEQPETVPLMRAPITGGPPELIFRVRLGSTITCSRLPANVCAIGEPTPDKSQVVVTAFDPVKGRGAELARIGMSAEFGYADFDMSPDGTQIAAIPGPNQPIQLISFRGGSRKVVPGTDLQEKYIVHWSSDGRGLFFVRWEKGVSKLVHIDLRGTTKVLWNNNEGMWPWGIPSPDGRHLAIQGSTKSANIWMMEDF